LNERVPCSICVACNDLERGASEQEAFWKCPSGSSCQSVTLSDAPDYLAEAWPKLAPHVREAILTLVDAAVLQAGGA
jgi:hypothetical protein